MFRSLKLLFISIFLVSGSCFALSSEEFDEQYRDLNGQLSKAVFTNMLYSRDYDDKKFHYQKNWNLKVSGAI